MQISNYFFIFEFDENLEVRFVPVYINNKDIQTVACDTRTYIRRSREKERDFDCHEYENINFLIVGKLHIASSTNNKDIECEVKRQQ